MRRTTIILYGILGGGVLVGRRPGHQPRRGPARRSSPLVAARGRAGFGLFVLAGATPAALGPAGRHLRALPDRPRRDHGPVLGLPRGRPDRRGAHRRRSRPTGAASTACSSPRPSCSCVALLPLAQLRDAGARRSAGTAVTSASAPPRDRRATVGAGPAGPGHARRGRRAAPPGDRGRPARSCAPAARAVDAAIATNAVARRRHAERLRHRRRRVLADLGRGDRAPARAQRLGSGAGRRRCRRAARGGLTDAPRSRTADDHGPGRGPVVGRRPRAPRPACRATRSWPRRSSWHGTGSRPGTASSTRSR